jgi:hypothetical protein
VPPRLLLGTLLLELAETREASSERKCTALIGVCFAFSTVISFCVSGHGKLPIGGLGSSDRCNT